MNRIISIALGATLLLGAAPAFAASISNPLFSNGQTSTDAAGGATVTGTYTLTVPPGEVVEWQRFQSDPSQPFADVNVPRQLGYEEQVYTNLPFSVKMPPNTGTYYPTVQGAGTFGGNRSINGGDNVVFGPSNLGTVRVVANGDTSVGTTPAKTDIQILAESVMNLSKFVTCIQTGGLWDGTTCTPKPVPVTPPAPPVNTKCQNLTEAMIGAQYGARNSSNVVLQGFLLSQHEQIPALAAGAAFGLWLNQTQDALTHFKGVNGCN